MKNIGFIAMKEKYPNDYKNMNFIFNDVDTLPFTDIFDYETQEGIVKHYYGFEDALGGIVVIKGCDFEKINGYPNFWGWGMEDASLQKRCNKHGLTIDRTNFYTVGSPEILQLFDGVSRIINKKETKKYSYDNGSDGLTSIQNLKYSIDKQASVNNEHIFEKKNIFMIHISSFSIPFIPEEKFFISMEHCGNTVSSTIPIALYDAMQLNKFDLINNCLIDSFKNFSRSSPYNKIAFFAISLVSILHKAQIALSLL